MMTTRGANAANQRISGRRRMAGRVRAARPAPVTGRLGATGAALLLTLAGWLAPRAVPPAAVLPAISVGSLTHSVAAPVDPQQVVDQAREKYDAARTYQDRVIVRHTPAPAYPEEAPRPLETRLELLFARPNLLVLRGDLGGVYCDGVTLWLHNGVTQEYIELPAPKALNPDDLDRQLPAVHLAKHPRAGALVGGGGGARLFSPPVERLLAAEEVERAGRPSYRVDAEGRAAPVEGGAVSPITLWFDGRTSLLEEMSIGEPPADPGPQAGLIASVLGARMDEEIPRQAFSFSPGPGDRRVEAFTDPSAGVLSAQGAMIGLPAPDVAGATLGGREFRTADLRGRVGVLVFWDTWCDACVEALAAAQRVADRLGVEGERVFVVGINQDSEAGFARVGALLEERKIMFEQVADSDNSFARAFSVGALPGTVLIDRDGVVQKHSRGFAAGQEEALERDIRALLSGRDLRVLGGFAGPK